MRSHDVHELLDDETRHFGLGARRTQNYSEFFSAEKDNIGTMGNASSDEIERVEAGVRNGRVVQLKRRSTPFPTCSRGSWNEGIYQIVGAGKVMYKSREVPIALRKQLGSGSVSRSGVSATIKFHNNDGNLDQYFQGFP